LFFIFNIKTRLPLRVLSYFDRYHRLGFMLISSKLTSAKTQQPSICNMHAFDLFSIHKVTAS